MPKSKIDEILGNLGKLVLKKIKICMEVNKKGFTPFNKHLIIVVFKNG